MSEKNVYGTGTLVNFESTDASVPKYVLYKRCFLSELVFVFLPIGNLEKSHHSLCCYCSFIELEILSPPFAIRVTRELGLWIVTLIVTNR